MRFAIAALLLAGTLLFGCIGVPQDRYDSLSKACDADKKTLGAAVDEQKAAAGSLSAKLSGCTVAKQAVENLLSAKEEETEKLRQDSALLASARLKLSAAGQYQLALDYYNDAFGPGKVPNTQKLNRIEAQVLSLNDPEAYSLWLKARNCQSISECDSAKSEFTLMLGSRMAGLEHEAAQIIRGS